MNFLNKFIKKDINKEEKKVESKNDSLLKKMWNHPQGNAAIKLSFWILGMIVLVAFIRFSTPLVDQAKKEETRKKEESRITLGDLKYNLRNASSYEFEYDININSDKYNFKGSFENSITSGYKEDNTGIIRYLIEEGKIYQVLNNEKVGEIDDLYKGINTQVIDLYYLFLLLTPKEYEENIVDELRVFTYKEFALLENDIYNVVIYANEENIEKIEISLNEDNYILKFRDVIKNAE